MAVLRASDAWAGGRPARLQLAPVLSSAGLLDKQIPHGRLAHRPTALAPPLMEVHGPKCEWMYGRVVGRQSNRTTRALTRHLAHDGVVMRLDFVVECVVLGFGCTVDLAERAPLDGQRDRV